MIFVIQMKGIDFFRPNDRTHAEFGEVLREAQKAGVEVLAYDCIVGEDRPAAGCAGGDQAVKPCRWHER